MVKPLSEITKEWADDAADFEHDPDLAKHSRRQLSLHQKYYNWLNQYLVRKHRMNAELARLKADKTDYFSNEMDLAKIKELGWPIQPKRMLKAEVTKAVDNDVDVVQLTIEVSNCTDIIKFLEEIIKKLNQRSFDIKNIIEYEKFTAGLN